MNDVLARAVNIVLMGDVQLTALLLIKTQLVSTVLDEAGTIRMLNLSPYYS